MHPIRVIYRIPFTLNFIILFHTVKSIPITTQQILPKTLHWFISRWQILHLVNIVNFGFHGMEKILQKFTIWFWVLNWFFLRMWFFSRIKLILERKVFWKFYWTIFFVRSFFENEKIRFLIVAIFFLRTFYFRLKLQMIFLIENLKLN